MEEGTKEDYERLAEVFRPTSLGMFPAAGAALLVGLARPSPLVLVIALTVIQSAVWTFAVSRWLRTDEATQRLG